MADSMHNVLPDKLVTIQDLVNEGFSIEKKFVMVDSRAYTPEAFEYVLKLADIAGSIVFIYDSKKIWANGRYFGGDVFQEDLNYFTEFASIDEFGHFTGIAQAHHPKELIKFISKGHVEVLAKYDSDTGENSISFDYNLKEAVNTERVEIDGAKYNLVVENGQIKLNQYKPMVVTLSSLSPLEYDSTDSWVTVSFKINISGTIPNPDLVQLKVLINTSDDTPVNNYELNEETNIFTAEIPANIDTKFTVYYSDGETHGTVTTWQRWGYAILIGLYQEVYFGEDLFDNNTFVNFNNIYNELYNNEHESLIKKIIWVPGTKFNTTIGIDLNYYSYGVIVCPYNMDMEFTDTSINLVGGWRPAYEKTGNKYYDNNEREFIVWRTDHKGIGLVNWKITGEENKNIDNE